MTNQLTFKEHTVTAFDNGDGKIWFTAEVLAELLGYKDVKQVNKIFNRHKDEFTGSMTVLTKVTMNGINNSLREVDTRLFSPRGAHLIGMVSRTKVAKDLRHWMLDLAEKESGVSLGALDVNSLAQLSGQQLHDAITDFDKKSFEQRGRKGSGLMAQRKRDIKKIKEATALALSLTQFSICDLGAFPEPVV
ncbi:BRO family protein [Serratia marcescens]|uniref:BRO family protein n=1 Tax=Serratia marcescens TaxID=615 RepID=UPI00148DADFA|nr:BRO family protein [Serratia marcescens]QJU39038.1 hypothetical protein HMI62_06730 [Serratia marcescens]